MAASRRLKRDLVVRDPVQAFELVWTERARVKMSGHVHHEVAQRMRPGTSPLPNRESVQSYNIGLLRTYVPWVRALGLQMIFIDGDVEQPMETRENLVSFIEGALKRRGLTMMEHIRRCMASGKPGGRAIKEMKMSRAADIQLGSLMIHMEQLGFTVVLRAA